MEDKTSVEQPRITKTSNEKYGSPISCRVPFDMAWEISIEAKKAGETTARFGSMLLMRGWQDWLNRSEESLGISEVRRAVLEEEDGISEARRAVLKEEGRASAQVRIDAITKEIEERSRKYASAAPRNR